MTALGAGQATDRAPADEQSDFSRKGGNAD